MSESGFHETASPNLDQKAIDAFNQQAHQWWDPKGDLAPLHALNPVRFDFIEKHCSPEGLRFLDVGCGGGLLSETLAQSGAHVTGIDLAPDLIEVARLHALESQLTVDYQTISVQSVAAQQPGQFDGVTCMELLEHVPDPAAIISACAQALKPGGWLFLSTINRHPKAYALAILAAENLLNIVPKGTHQYQQCLKPSELDAMARAAHLQLVDTAGMDYNPILKRCRLSNDLRVNYLMAFQKPC